MDTKLKQFYSSSRNYLRRLERHDEQMFGSYLWLCKTAMPIGSSILDCGCGIGVSSYLLAKSGFRVTAIDISPLFISEAEKRYGNQSNLAFLIGDVLSMPFRSNSFDAVCSYDLLEHVTDVRGALREMCRIVKTGGLLIAFMPNHLDPVQHLMACIRWKTKDKYKPWEARSRVGAFCQSVRNTFLTIGKALNINRRIYYLEPVLQDDENVCGEDFDATWLTNWFDVENALKELGIFIKDTVPQDFEDRIMSIMRKARLPKALQSFYIKMRAQCVILGVKK